MSIQISGPVIPPDGSVTAVKIGSGAAPDGQVLTADGAGGAAWEAVPSSGTGYLEYVALLTQSGTAAPVATVLKNTLGGTVVWTYQNTGQYTGTLANAFPQAKTTFYMSSPGALAALLASAVWATIDTFSVNTIWFGEGSIAATNDLLIYTPIEIRVYP